MSLNNIYCHMSEYDLDYNNYLWIDSGWIKYFSYERSRNYVNFKLLLERDSLYNFSKNVFLYELLNYNDIIF
jgi:hypothetical protein